MEIIVAKTAKNVQISAFVFLTSINVHVYILHERF